MVVLLCSLLTALGARAQDKSVVAAANAFTQAQQAELNGDFERAAELFELADRIAPTPEALRSATRARSSAGQHASAAGHAEALLRRYPSDAASGELAEKVIATARPTHTRYLFECTEPCTVVVDGLAANVSALRAQPVYVSPGSHQFLIGFDGSRTRGLRLHGIAGEARTIQITPPAPQAVVAAASVAAPAAGASRMGAAASSGKRPADSDSASRRLAPVYFWTVASAAVATGAVALWSGLDLLRARDDFKGSSTPTRAQFDAGEKKDLRTSLLIGASGALLAGSVGLFLLTDFDRAEQKQTTGLSFDRHGAQWTLQRRF